ncbi:ferritin-like domain-containing protein [Novosphingobium sp. KACC 22771]|uniref:ferritin-like domain-containing protein n=1 Tax=Novosphingobium sp. KACC 22771 TaxID=3025670 RepID=UPI002365AE8A|nr:ferritin-like domain-containing protein [Novosphingobium sp. KACC 22771]WDF73442.1 ferritin-like domain-containing protein [Novosphingobium sp. KACC 22771]
MAGAAEIEHDLMCCYLYAAFSINQGTDEGLSDDALGRVRGWRRTIISVAVEERAARSIASPRPGCAAVVIRIAP